MLIKYLRDLLCLSQNFVIEPSTSHFVQTSEAILFTSFCRGSQWAMIWPNSMLTMFNVPCCSLTHIRGGRCLWSNNCWYAISLARWLQPMSRWLPLLARWLPLLARWLWLLARWLPLLARWLPLLACWLRLQTRYIRNLWRVTRCHSWQQHLEEDINSNQHIYFWWLIIFIIS